MFLFSLTLINGPNKKVSGYDQEMMPLSHTKDQLMSEVFQTLGSFYFEGSLFHIILTMEFNFICLS